MKGHLMAKIKLISALCRFLRNLARLNKSPALTGNVSFPTLPESGKHHDGDSDSAPPTRTHKRPAKCQRKTVAQNQKEDALDRLLTQIGRVLESVAGYTNS